MGTCGLRCGGGFPCGHSAHASPFFKTGENRCGPGEQSRGITAAFACKPPTFQYKSPCSYCFPTPSSPQKARRVATRDAANLFDYPLTHQEKLLVEFARTATPDELKELNPEYQAKVEAKQEAEFAAYLNPAKIRETAP